MKELIKAIVERASSMNQAAKRAGISQASISEYCSGRVSPGLEKYVALCLAVGCRPGWELDRHLGMGEASPRYAEDVLGMVLELDIMEQQRLISIITSKYSQFLAVENMIDTQSLLSLVKAHLQDNKMSAEQFINVTGLDSDQCTLLMNGVLPPTVEEANVVLSLIATELKNPTTNETFSSREELIAYCGTKSKRIQPLVPNGTSHH